MFQARHSVLAADGMKWNQAAPVRFAAWTDFECWLTSDDLSPVDVKPLKEFGVKVIRRKG